MCRGLILTLLPLTVAVALSSAAQLPCEESGYCSVGISKHWVGDIKTGAKLKEFLEAVTYKRELILNIFEDGDEALWTDLAVQLRSELESMGYAHHVAVTDSLGSCEKLNKLHPFSCVWDSSELPYNVLSGAARLWYLRWKLTARAVRLGYNIMSIDTDFMFFRDPYYHLKRPPFTDVQMLTAFEGGGLYSNNGGFMYVQNARPDGPVSWVFKQMTMNALRRADDGYEYMSKWTGNKRNCINDDQAIMYETLISAAVGRLIFPFSLMSCKGKSTFSTRTGNNLTEMQVRHNLESLVAAHIRSRQTAAPPDPEWLAKNKVKFMPEMDSRMPFGNITVPNLNWGYPEELGGRFAPEAPGPLSGAFVQQLKDDCPDCPWWPERRPVPDGANPLLTMLGPNYNEPNVNPENAYAFWQEGVPQEKHAQTPYWFESSLSHVRHGWVLGRHAPIQGPMVLGHIHAWHLQTHRSHKLMLRKIYGRYNWTLGELIAASSGHANAYAVQREVKRVIALSPNMDLTRLRTWEEFSSVVTGLLQVSMMTGRIPLMPMIPCQAAFMHDPHNIEDPQANTTLCVAPAFWRTPYGYPLPLAVAVDEKGELVGGWARRLRRHHSRSGPDYLWPSTPAVLLTPAEAQDTTPEDAGAARQQHRKLLQDDVPDDFWEKQRYQLIQPGEWDGACTKDFHALTPPEFYHWLKHNEEGKRASLQPSPSNTAFQVSAAADALKLQPLPAPGGDASAVPAGSVVRPSYMPGWSLYDVQAALPAQQVVNHMRRYDNEPLVYMEHPVMVVHSTEDAATQQNKHAADLAMTQQTHAGLQWLNQVFRHGNPDAISSSDPDMVLSTINYHIRHHRCKATFVKPEAWDGVHVNLTHGRPSVLIDGHIRPV